MLDLMPYVWSRDVVVKALWVIFYDNLALALAFVFPLDELLLQIFVGERLDERAEFFLLVVSSRPAGVHKNGGTEHCGQDLGFLKFSLVDVEHDEQVEVDTLVVVGGGAEFDGAEVDLPVDHLHLALTADTHVYQRHTVSLFILSVLLDCEDLGLSGKVGT